MNTIYIVDAVNFLFRSYFAIGPMTNSLGESTNALFGFIRSLNKIIKDFAPSHIVAVFDGPDNKQGRSAIYSEYKAHRTKMPEDLFPQLERAVAYCEMASIPYLMVSGVEADDTMGSIAKWAEQMGTSAFLCSSDKDLCQLVSDKIFVINPHKDNLLINQEKVKELFGVTPSQIVDYLAIVGDASDNIPGLEGFGPKTATDLLNKYGTLDSLIAHSEDLSGKKRETLIRDKAIALMSRELATIQIEVDFPHDPDFFKLKSPNIEQLKEFYHSMGFLSLLKEIEKPLPESEEKTDYQTIQSLEEWHSLLDLLQRENKGIAFSTLSDPELIGIAFSIKPGQAWYLSLQGKLDRNQILQDLKNLIENHPKGVYSHDAKSEMHRLLREEISIQNVAFDTLIASQLLAPHVQKHSLSDLALLKLGRKSFSLEELLGKGKNKISMRDLPEEKIAQCCCQNADYIGRLSQLLAKEIADEKMDAVFYDIEIPLISVLFHMERNGIYVDKEELKHLSLDLSQKIKNLEGEIFAIAGQTFNINSPKQLGIVLFEHLGIKPAKKTATGYSTAADILDALKGENPIIHHILLYRVLEKLRSTYVDALPEQISPVSSRIHCTFNQIGAATGRLSCQDPNLQNIPIRTEEGRKIRKAFKPQKEGWSYLAADYSQIELRLLAHLSEDPSLIQAFQAGEDIHAFTASLVFNVPLDEVTPLMRHKAKAVNFGIIYGQQAFGLSQGLDMDYQEAATFIQTYFQRYKHVKNFFDSCKEQARKLGYATTLNGRRRPIPEITSPNPLIRSTAERLAMNTPLQGTAADLIKIAMLKIDQLLNQERHPGKMILQIHDELLFEVPDDQIQAFSSHVKKIMENVYELKVPLVVDISIEKNWGEC